MDNEELRILLTKQREACAASIKGTSELAKKTREIILATPLVKRTDSTLDDVYFELYSGS